jgi:hypothetical protein
MATRAIYMRQWEVMPDEALERLGNRFRRMRIEALTHTTFEQYLRDPEHYELQAMAIRRRMNNGRVR